MNKTTLVITVSRRRFLKEAFLSIRNQVFKEFDMVIAIDTHKESDLLQYTTQLVNAILNEWDGHIVIKDVEGNGSAGFIRNIGFGLSQSEWIIYMDDDDELNDQAMLIMDHYLNRYGNGIYSSGIYRIEEDGKRRIIPESITWFPTKQLFMGNPMAVNTPTYFNQLQAIKKSEWEKYVFRNEMGEDLDYVMHHLLRIPFIRVPYYLYGYRNNPNSLSHLKEIDIFTERYESGYYYCLYYSSCSQLIK